MRLDTSNTLNYDLFFQANPAFSDPEEIGRSVITYVDDLNGQTGLLLYVYGGSNSESKDIMLSTPSGSVIINGTNTNLWNDAYGWGDHSLEGYLTTAVLSVSNTDGNLVVGVDSQNPTIDLAEDIEIAGSLTVQGDLTVNGDVTTLNTATMNVEDNIFVLNSNVTGTPSVDAGIEVERGDDTNSALIWNETSNTWEAGLVGSTVAISRKFVATTTGTTHTITHNLGTSDVTVNCWLAGEQVEANVVVTDSNTVTVTTNASVTLKTVVVG